MCKQEKCEVQEGRGVIIFCFLNSVYQSLKGNRQLLRYPQQPTMRLEAIERQTNVEVWLSEGINTTMSARENDQLREEDRKVILGSRLNINVEP